MFIFQFTQLKSKLRCKAGNNLPLPKSLYCTLIGPRKQEDDVREKVFKRVTDIIVDQGKKGCLFFVLEMVMGIDHRKANAMESYYQIWIETLRKKAPMWQITPWDMNAVHWSPQHRRRLYTVGTNRHCVVHPFPPAPPYQQQKSPQPLRSILHVGLGVIQEKRLSPQQQDNLIQAKRHLISENVPGDVMATISVDRRPSASFAGTWCRYDGTVPTLRTGNELVWLYMPSQGISRCLHPVERFAVQGFAPEVGWGLSKAQMLEVTGNAFSVPVAAAVLHQVLWAVAGYVGIQGPPRPLSMASTNCHMQQLNLMARLRDLIALQEREQQLLSRKRARSEQQQIRSVLTEIGNS